MGLYDVLMNRNLWIDLRDERMGWARAAAKAGMALTASQYAAAARSANREASMWMRRYREIEAQRTAKRTAA